MSYICANLRMENDCKLKLQNCHTINFNLMLSHSQNSFTSWLNTCHLHLQFILALPSRLSFSAMHIHNWYNSKIANFHNIMLLPPRANKINIKGAFWLIEVNHNCVFTAADGQKELTQLQHQWVKVQI